MDLVFQIHLELVVQFFKIMLSCSAAAR